MLKTMKLLVVMSCFLVASAYADTIILVLSPGALGANDSVNWSQLGGDATTIPNSFSATSANSHTVNGSFNTTTGLSAVVCPVGIGTCSWSPASGGFAPGDTLIWAFDNTANAGTGPLTLLVPQGFGVGAAIQADVLPGNAFSAKLELFNGAVSLGSVTESSNANGDAIFLGALDVTGAHVNKAVFSLISGPAGFDANDFAIDLLSLNNQPAAVPEPGTFFLLGGPLVGVAWKLKRSVGRR